MPHTKGKWSVLEFEKAKQGYSNWNTYCIRSANNCHLATVGAVDRYYEKDTLANARLIAAAPDLLDALELASKHLDAIDYGDAWDRDHAGRLPEIIRSAIAKAKG